MRIGSLKKLGANACVGQRGCNARRRAYIAHMTAMGMDTNTSFRRARPEIAFRSSSLRGRHRSHLAGHVLPLAGEVVALARVLPDVEHDRVIGIDDQLPVAAPEGGTSSRSSRR